MQKEKNAIQEAQEYIFSIPKFSSKNSLEETKAFLQKIGNPGGNLKVIHVAGTNGKGSVCAYLSSVLKEAGYKVGLFTSPHLENIRERFQVQQEMISEVDFLNAYRKVKTEVYREQKGGNSNYHPSFFEFLFIMALYYFEQQQVDILVLETGLGGRLDATNVVEHPLVCGITRIGLDHIEYLGTTISEIAFEKAGIIKSSVPVCYWNLSNEVSRVIESRAREQQSISYSVCEDDYLIHSIGKKSIDFSMDSEYYGYIRLILSTGALYQVENAALAVRIIEVLNQNTEIKQKISKESLIQGIYKMHWHGRMEEILPDVFLDGAHNEDGILAFLETVKRREHQKPSLLVFSVVMEKDYQPMIRAIEDSRLFREIIVTRLDNNRALSIESMKEVFRGSKEEKITYIEHAEKAFLYGLQHKNEDETLYVAGSLYLVGNIMTLCHKKNFWEDMS